VRSILLHPWLTTERPFDPIKSLEMVRTELVVFQQTLDDHKRKNYGRINISKEEAINIVRQHQQSYVISDEVQSVFRE
jgi:hypothetical protein